MIGGFSPSHIPMIIAGKEWISIIVIIVVIIISSMTKQPAVLSIGVSLTTQNNNVLSHTRYYTTCNTKCTANTVAHIYPVIHLDALNSIRNPNFTYSNKYYDRSIPTSLQG